MREFAIVSGSSNKILAENIAKELEVQLVDPKLVRFANGEIFCEIEKSVRGTDVFLIQSTSMPVNDHLMELLIMVDALKRASAQSITVVMPFYGYARQDRKVSPRTPISAKLVADLITVAGATRVITMDLHAGQIQGFFNIPFDNIFASPVILNFIQKEIYNENTVFVSPDAGGVERVRFFAKKLNCDIALIDKRRTGKNVAEALGVIGQIEGKECIIIDDMIDTAGTLVEACRILKSKGATRVYACATHPIFSRPAIERIKNCDDLDSVIVTDTIPLSEEAKGISKIKVLSTTKILAEAIHRTFKNDSVSSLFI